jgi:hypothetical protein
MRLNGKIIVPFFKIMLESKQGKCNQPKPNQTKPNQCVDFCIAIDSGCEAWNMGTGESGHAIDKIGSHP